MRRSLLVAFVVLLAPGGLRAQETPDSDMSAAARVTAATWQTLQEKIEGMARDFPRELFSFRPHPDSRSFVDEMWHIATGNEALAAQLRGESIDPSSLVVTEDEKYDRDRLVARLTAAAEECTNLLRTRFQPRSIRTLEHMGEHYGKLVTIYRVNGLVPPASR